MLMNFGDFSDKAVEWVMLREPSYVNWMLSVSNPYGQMKRIRDVIVTTLIPNFDSKHPLEACFRCKANLATYATGYEGNATLIYWWCEDCDPRSLGANPGKLVGIRKYEHVLEFAQRCGGAKGDYKKAMKRFSEGIGAPKRLTESAAEKFFS